MPSANLGAASVDHQRLLEGGRRTGQRGCGDVQHGSQTDSRCLVCRCELTTALAMSALHCTTPANVAMAEFTLSTAALSVTAAAVTFAVVQLMVRCRGRVDRH